MNQASEVKVSEVIGEGQDARREIVVAGWAMTAWVNDAEPRIRDTDLAERLGHDRPRDVRKMVARLEKEGEISEIYMRATVALISKPNGGTEERAVNECWLTESQALMVAMHSRTEKAKAIRVEMIRVYTLARRGLLPNQQSELARLVAGLHAELVSLRSEVKQLAVSNQNTEAYWGGIGRVKADIVINSRIASIAVRLAKATGRKVRSVSSSIHHDLREKVKWARGWEYLPATSLGLVTAELTRIDSLTKAEERKQGIEARADLERRQSKITGPGWVE